MSKKKFSYDLKTLLICCCCFVPIPLLLGVFLVHKGINFQNLGPYGDFFAGSTVPVLTLVSFLAIIVTLKQQQDQLELQKKEINDTNFRIYNDSLPDRIIKLEESIDIVQSVIEQIEELKAEDLADHLLNSPDKREIKLFKVDGNYVFTMNETYKDLTELKIKKIRNNIVKVNSKAYQEFLELKNGILSQYFEKVHPMNSEFTSFYQKIMADYMDSHDSTIIYGELSEINLDLENAQKLADLRTSLYYMDKEYLQAISELYNYFNIKLNNILTELINELK
ncbi:hypothetical protein JMN23_16825 [Bacillus sp. RHFB]|nr:hypothetical protein [Bacillus sp. RHFB]